MPNYWPAPSVIPRWSPPPPGHWILWTDQVEAVLNRLLAQSPIGDIADIPGLARAVSAAFVGLELYEGVDADGASQALAALDQLAVLVEVMDNLGPVARRALRARLGRTTRSQASGVPRSVKRTPRNPPGG